MTDNELLLQLQARYRAGDIYALDLLYKESLGLCKRFIKSICRNKRLSLDAYTLNMKAHDAAAYYVSRYSDAEFNIKTSAAAYLYRCSMHELYTRRKIDRLVMYIPYDELQRFAQSYIYKGVSDETEDLH